MIPTLTIDMTAALAPFGWVGLAAVLAGFAVIVGATLREQLRPRGQGPVPAAVCPADIAA